MVELLGVGLVVVGVVVELEGLGAVGAVGGLVGSINPLAGGYVLCCPFNAASDNVH